MTIDVTDRYTEGRVIMKINPAEIIQVIPEGTGSAVILADGNHPIDVLESRDEVIKRMEVAKQCLPAK